MIQETPFYFQPNDIDSEYLDDYERKLPLLLSIFMFGVPLWLFIYLIVHWLLGLWTLMMWTL